MHPHEVKLESCPSTPALYHKSTNYRGLGSSFLLLVRKRERPVFPLLLSEVIADANSQDFPFWPTSLLNIALESRGFRDLGFIASDSTYNQF